MKHKRDLDDKELLGFKHMDIQDNKGKEKDISDSSEEMQLDIPSSEDDSSEQLFQKQLPPLYDPFNSIMFQYLPTRDLANFARACKQTEAFASDELEQRKVSASLLAVVQGNQGKVKSMLEINPDLLYRKEGKATDYSGRQIQNVTPFQAALCAGDVEMCEIMKKDYFSELEGGQAESESQFSEIFPNGIEAYVQKQKDNVFDFNKILRAIIDAPEDEVTTALNKVFDNQLPLHRALEKFRTAFTEKSLSEIVFNPYHLLQAFETYKTEFHNLGNLDYWDKRDLFWRQVIGFVQRYLPACYFQSFVQGIYYIVEEKQPLRRSFDFSWGGGSILSAKNFSGLGFDYAAASGGIFPRCNTRSVHSFTFLLVEIMCEQKISTLAKLLNPIQPCKIVAKPQH